jgi:hypothetical protein
VDLGPGHIPNRPSVLNGPRKVVCAERGP